MRDPSKLLYDIAYKELSFERERTRNIELKAYRFITFGSIAISLIASYFFIITGTTGSSVMSINILLLISLGLSLISIVLLMISLKTYKFASFNIIELIKQFIEVEYDYDVALKRLIGSLNEYIEIYRLTNNKKVKLIKYGIGLFFASLISITFGIILQQVQLF